MSIEIIILSGIIIFLVILNIIEKWQFTKRESDLFDRLMAKSHDDYAANKVRMSTIKKKPQHLGDVSKPEEVVFPVD